jgi:hypothetical protein
MIPLRGLAGTALLPVPDYRLPSVAFNSLVVVQRLPIGHRKEKTRAICLYEGETIWSQTLMN